MLNRLKKLKLIQLLSSVKLTVVCIFLLFVLTFWGTIAQVEHGLYQAQEQYFNSLFFLAFGFLPFPGGQGVLWVLFVNLLAATVCKFQFKANKIGILVIHFGLLLFLVSGYITLHGATESYISLREGQGSNISNAYHKWELSIFPADSTEGNIHRTVKSIDISHLRHHTSMNVPEVGVEITLQNYYPNAKAYTNSEKHSEYINASGITFIEGAAKEIEPEKNKPAAILDITNDKGKQFKVLLFGGETRPTTILSQGKAYNIILRLKRYELPFVLTLKDFMMEKHPGTETARSFKSLIHINNNNIDREKLISMNNPLRYNSFTFYQASYGIDNEGRELSTLAVVENSGRILPYIATFVTVAGLIVHFLMMAFNRKKRRKR